MLPGMVDVRKSFIVRWGTCRKFFDAPCSTDGALAVPFGRVIGISTDFLRAKEHRAVRGGVT